MPNQIRILVTEPEYFTPKSLERMRRTGTVIAKRMPRKELLRATEKVDVLVVRVETKVDKELLGRAKKLQCVVSATTGLNHIDVEELRRKGIPLFSLHGTHSISTAEHALALLFSSARNIPAAHIEMRNNAWARWKHIGTELTGKTLGLFGIGRVGNELAKRARGLHINVIAYDPYVSKKEMARGGVEKASWATLLKKSDFISLHAHLTKETRWIFGDAAFRKMKRSAILINTARGDLVKESALLSALKNRRIRAAAIDVYPEEPLPSSSALRKYAKKHQNLILTPHLGATTHEAIQNASAFAADAVVKFFRYRK